MQNIKEWPLFVKVGFGIVIAALTVAGLIEVPKLNESTAQEESLTELVNVEIIVESDSSTPLENVEVRFVSKGSPEIRRTDTSGFTQIEIPARTDIEITLSKEGFQTARYNLNLNNDPNRTRTYYLKPEQP